MPNAPHLLSFATDADGSQVFIHADLAGLDQLIASLTKIRAKVAEGNCEHDHLMSKAWGGSQLSETKLENEAHLVQHVKIYGWTPDWARKNKLIPL